MVDWLVCRLRVWVFVGLFVIVDFMIYVCVITGLICVY